ncbi:uncharacterized protein A4U43_UnF5130 [Asparagus officinalis]|uniref:R13L1/DRL21-like LRR repeat region domain-containing protein n=1 Tax=Asparagus officinalis TaxID=4686 RepID=A0A1R3L6R6_ASPOF|nr:putative disease resistance protein At3g14460 [Asparagus officinalis]ONK55312.1 uncharacterized protein A4U43_UnF5130 [Asparagus officinalis]
MEMNKLHGRLCISNLENVDTKEEANQAMLNNKKCPNELRFKWIFDMHAQLGIDVPDADVLDALQPHPNHKDLKVITYGGVKYPSWLNKTSLPKLKSMFLGNCKSLEQLPSLGHWPSLKYLKFGCVNAVRQVGLNFYGTPTISSFPVLEHLSCWNMPEWDDRSSTDARQLFPCVLDLYVKDYPKLRRLPCIPFSLVKLRLSKVG